ncbi:hypothetical protein N0V83_003311 [Neocucurbitaria cava]|uniref:non-specific serine/threonine protein kinase n=1 Tax=Neocucurbitaria cava TaxID=798079 RepID=A0A9W9CP62_9PLEO|nr:hypothetical protein N0V83_003311 [Neocucurbitaria cava]
MSDSKATPSPDPLIPLRSRTNSPTQDVDYDVSESEDSDDEFSRRPRIPYVKGFTFSAQQHAPPDPFGRDYDTEYPPAQENWKALSQTHYCLSCPPREGQIYPEESRTLTITSTIRSGYDRGAQLVVVDNSMVAKIYDPLYYADTDAWGSKEDVVHNADCDYSREAAAYIQLQKSQAARDVTPAFYGTWTIEVETLVGKIGQQKPHKRHVRFILMEWLRGETMCNIRPVFLRRPVRSLILKKALHAEAIISTAGLIHRDFCPRNIIVLGDNYDAEISVKDIRIKVKVFDFNISTVIDHPRYELHDYAIEAELFRAKWHPRIESPIIGYFGHMNEFCCPGWCSDEDMGPEKWLWKHFHNDPRFIPVIWDPNNPDKDPSYADRASLKDGSDSGFSSGGEVKEEGERSSESDSAQNT